MNNKHAQGNGRAQNQAQSADKSAGFDESYAKSEFVYNPLGREMDPYEVPGKDPNRAYKWISYTVFKQNGMRDFRGWCPLTKETQSTEQLVGFEERFGSKGDGFVHKGSLILAFMPQEIFKKYQARKREAIRNRTSGINNDANRHAAQLSRRGKASDVIYDETTETNG